MNKRETGSFGEKAAAEYLCSLGYEIVETNFTVRGGEIDIIALDGSTLVFAEVKSRKMGSANAAEAVDATKIRRMLFSAEQYIRSKSSAVESLAVRFDCIEVYIGTLGGSVNTVVNHIKNIDVT